MRRASKSYLLFKIFKCQLLIDGAKEDHIIEVALNDFSMREYRNPDKLYAFVKNKITDGDKYYILLDEVQMLDDFVDVLNGLLHINNAELHDLFNIIASNIGSLTNPTKLSNTFKSEKHVDIKSDTINRYIEFFKDSFLIEETTRYDIKGRKYINTPHKYYFSDMGLRNTVLNFRQIEPSHIMENIIYNEIRMRGYSVDVGMVTQYAKGENDKTERRLLEVDFVCNRGFKRYYIQSALEMPTEEKREQEFNSLLRINDGFKKIVIVGGMSPTYQDDNGILILNIYDFLMNENSLDI